MSFGFVLSFLGAFCAAILVAYLDARFRHPLDDNSSATALEHPQIRLLRISAFLVAFAWAGIALFLIGLVLAFAGAPIDENVLIGPIAFTLLIATPYAIMAFRVHCESCGKPILVQWTTKPKHAVSSSVLDGWASIVLRLIRRRSFACMYCGQNYCA